MKKFNLALLLLGVGFLACLIWRSGPGNLAKQVAELGWGIVWLIAVEGAGNLAHTLGWRYCMSRDYWSVPFLRLFRMAQAASAINYLVPTASVGGELSRGGLLASSIGGPEAASSIVLDKLMTAVAHIALVTLGAVFLFDQANLPVGLWIGMVVSTSLLGGGIFAFLLLQKYGKLGHLCRWLVKHHLAVRFAQDAGRHIAKVDEALKEFYLKHTRNLVLSVFWHMIGHSAAIGHAWFFLVLLGQPAPLATVVAAGILSLWFDLLTFAVPLNMGTLEASRVMVLKALGCQPLLGMTFGVAMRIVQVFWACFGLAAYAQLADLFRSPESSGALPAGCRLEKSQVTTVVTRRKPLT